MSTSIQVMDDGVTEAHIAEVRAMIGRDLRIEQYNHEATYDSIRHYAHGIGDDNPLWCDPDYGACGPHGVMVAPPTFFLRVFATTILPGLPTLHAFHGGGDYHWNRLARRGETLRARSRVTDLVERQGRTVARMFLQHSETTYTTDDGEVLAVFGARSFRTPRPAQETNQIYQAKPPREYSRVELEEIAADVFAEDVRGATPRYWESVEPGDRLQPVVKGPLDRITMTCFYAGAMPAVQYRAAGMAWRFRRLAVEHPDVVPNNFPAPKDLYFLGHGGNGHHDSQAAHAVGMPGAYDNGHMRIGWVAHLITNWMGDTGFLRDLHTEIRRPNVVGNTTWFKGEVTDKRVDGDTGEHVVDISLIGEDQDGTINTKGHATVVLPTRH